MTAVRFLLNGEPWSAAGVPPTMTVLDWLRGRARLTGTKEGCAEGDCGACSIVLGQRVNGSVRYQAVNACLMMLPQIDGCSVLTVEGLASPDGSLHPVQQAFKECHGLQCGYCTPGMVMNIVGRFEEPQPLDLTDDGIRDLLSGNLCRCTGYLNIIAAVRRAAELLGRT